MKLSKLKTMRSKIESLLFIFGLCISLFLAGRVIQTQPQKLETYIPTNSRSIYVSPQGYLNPQHFSPVVKTMTQAMRIARRGDVIILYGKLRESKVITPYGLVDVTIRGMSPVTRPGNTSTPNGIMGGSSDWGNNSSNINDALLTITNSGWTIENMHFGGAPNGAAILLERDIAGTKNANHTKIINNAFSGGPRAGIEDKGGNARVIIRDNEFFDFTGTAIMNSSISVAWPLMWKIEDNIFINNRNNIILPLSASIIRNNIFFRNGFSRSSDTVIRLDRGKNNFIFDNYFSHPSMVLNWVGGAYGGGENNTWGPNHYSDGTKSGEPREDGNIIGNANLRRE